jgi:predicted GH43/DUF377 family glycosyl hydrolase
LIHWTKHGPIFGDRSDQAPLKYKSSGIVTRVDGDHLVAAMIQGRYWMFWGEGEIHLATSRDLIHWVPRLDSQGRPIILLRKRAGSSDSDFPETGAPAVVTPHGIVLLYNGRNASDDTKDPAVGVNAYTVHEALFSATSPETLIDRTDAPVLQPLLAWEKSGQYPAGTTFAEGLVHFNGRWWLYYGAADSFVGVVTTPTCGKTK